MFGNFGSGSDKELSWQRHSLTDSGLSTSGEFSLERLLSGEANKEEVEEVGADRLKTGG